MKALFYSLNAAIWVHALPENRLVRELSAAGYEVTYVTCGSSFPQHCTSMSAYGVSYDCAQDKKDAVCKICTRNAGILAHSNTATHLQLSNFIMDADHEAVAALVNELSPTDYLDFEYMGVSVGRLAAYELFLKYKKMSAQLMPDEWDYCKLYVRNCLLSLLGFSRLFEQEKPDLTFFYSPQYGLNGVCAQFAEKQGCSVYFVEGSSSNSERYRALRIWQWSAHGLVNPALQYWSEAATITAKEVRRLRGHFRELVRGKSFAVYSSPVTKDVASLRDRFNVAAGSKIVLMTLSSFDEAYAAHMIGRFPDSKVMSSVFRDQFEWVKETLRQLADRNDLVVIVRVHPRDFPNKREGAQSEQAAIWMEIFHQAPANVRVNWPHDQLSLYDMLREVDVVLTGWSATGVEALALAIPVVTYDSQLPSYPSEIHLSGSSREQYYQNIETALQSGRKFQYADGAFRWLGLSFSRGTVRIAPPVQTEVVFRFLIFRRLRAMAYRMFDGVVKRIDARRGFGPQGEAKRFLRLLESRGRDIFEVSKGGPGSEEDKAAAARAIDLEHRKFSSAIGLQASVDDTHGVAVRRGML